MAIPDGGRWLETFRQAMRSTTQASFLIFLCFASVIRAGDALDALQGAWVSDKEGTISELKKSDWWTDQRLAAIEGVLGRLIVRYEGKTCHARMDDWRQTYEVAVRHDDGQTIELEWQDSQLGKQSSKVEIFGDHLWVTPNGSDVFRERFVRWNPEAEQADISQPAAAPEPKIEGEDKPHSTSEGRSR